MIERQCYIEAVSFQMKNQDPERDERRTSVNLKTEVRENLFKIQVTLFSKGIHLTKPDYYFGVVDKC